MSQDRGRHQPGAKQPARGQRTHAQGHAHARAGRPSLFAPADNGADDDDADMQRVHILSTLESARQPPRVPPSKAPSQRPSIIGEGSPWQIKMLMALMGTGIVCLMTAFTLLVLDNSATRQAQAAPTPEQPMQRTRPIQADRHNPLAALMTSPTSASPTLQPEQEAAIIENLPVDPTAPVTTPISAQAVHASLQAAGGHRTSDGIQPPEGAQAETLADLPSVGKADWREPAPARPMLALTAPQADHAMSERMRPWASGSSAPAAVRQADKSEAAGRRRAAPVRTKDDDVALLEAVLAHSATRKLPAQTPTPISTSMSTSVPASVADELQRCGALGGAASATCRARICVQHPTTPACLQIP